MARVALVTGGTRGIGKAISEKLAKSGFKVAANYAGNDKAAAELAKSVKIDVFKWDVGDWEACQAGIRRVEEEVGPIDVLVNNAGITRDAVFHRMNVDQWREVIRVDLDSLFYVTRPVIEGMRTRGFGRIINISSINGQKGPGGPSQLLRRQGRHDRVHQGAGPGERQQGHHCELCLPRVHRHRDGGRNAGGCAGQDRRHGPGRPARQGHRDRRDGGVPGGGQRSLHHRRDHDGERRPIHRGLIALKARRVYVASMIACGGSPTSSATRRL
jgi:NAD(P)-dependent dehydrogenase (short-subunit alcohol dehydrogenase family)